jgi:hypothetical protein
MPILFRCDNCNDEREVSYGHEADGLARNCSECGQDLCDRCISESGYCEPCEEKRKSADYHDFDDVDD